MKIKNFLSGKNKQTLAQSSDSLAKRQAKYPKPVSYLMPDGSIKEYKVLAGSLIPDFEKSGAMSGLDRLQRLISKREITPWESDNTPLWESSIEVDRNSFGKFYYVLYDNVKSSHNIHYEYVLGIFHESSAKACLYVSLEGSPKGKKPGKLNGPYICVFTSKEHLNYGLATICLNRQVFFHAATHLASDHIYIRGKGERVQLPMEYLRYCQKYPLPVDGCHRLDIELSDGTVLENVIAYAGTVVELPPNYSSNNITGVRIYDPGPIAWELSKRRVT